MSRHIPETGLALYVSGDLSLWHRAMVRVHLNGCERCRKLVESYRSDRASVRELVGGMPGDVDWDRLAAEMTANIRVGLAAGECVAPRPARAVVWGWRPVAVMAGLVVLLAGGWWLNMPPAETQALGRAVRSIWHGRGAGMADEHGPVVAVSASGIELRENGSALAVSQGAARPVAVSVSMQGSASASYVDTDTGQVTITSVYVQ
jgi:anti-sigma factor RsiW